MRKQIFIFCGIIVMMFLMVSCVPGDGKNTASNPAGFFWGIWHGWIAPISLIVGIFNKSIRVYEVHNTGWWYDLGFYMAVIGGFFQLRLLRRKKK